jgi:V8-like Glu-specific endopeptidase
MRHACKTAVLLGAAMLALGSSEVMAQRASGSVSVVSLPTAAETEAYWTPERLRSAVPFPIPAGRAAQRPARPAPAAAPVRVKSQSSPSGRPSVEPIPAEVRLLEPVDSETREPGTVGSRVPASRGLSEAPFTTSRVFPTDSVTEYPNRLAGKLFFSNGTSGSYCSAAVIQRRLLITAAHCLYSPVLNRYHSGFLFIPAYFADAAPFGKWTAARARVPQGWINGGSRLPSEFDFGTIELNDASNNVRIGDRLGWFGWETYAAIGKHLTQIGYPLSLDDGNRMILSQSVGRENLSSKNVYIGSAQGRGSSGGPWIKDYGVQPAGQILTDGAAFNNIVAVTSYIIGDANLQAAGATVLNNTWADLFRTACADRPGNCQ